MSRLKIYGYPYGDNSSASARIRFHRVLGAMEGIDVVSSPENADVVYIQKRADGNTIALAEQYGSKMVYDIDDAPGQCSSVELSDRMMSLAKIMTTDTLAKLELFSNFGTKVRLVHDCLDYWDEKPVFPVQAEIKKVLAFGWDHSIMATIPFLLSLRNTFLDIEIRYVTGYEMFKSERFTFVQWSPDAVKREMMDSDVAVVCHPQNEAGKLRPSTRLITCMAAGIPVLALNSGNHIETLDDIGLTDNLLFSGCDIVDKFRYLALMGRRDVISKKFQEYAWRLFTPAMIAKKLRTIFEEVASA